MGKNTDGKLASLRAFYIKHPIICNIAFIFIASLLLLLASSIFLKAWTRHGAVSVVPDVRQMSYDRAYDTLDQLGFKVEINDSVYDDKIAPGTVLESWPRPGATVKPGREIFLTVTSFQPRKVRIAMPLKDVSSRQALSYLESLGLKNVRIKSVPSQFPDLVLSAKYQGKEITADTQLPVNALVELEVGTVPTVEDVEVSETIDQIETEQTETTVPAHQQEPEEPQSEYYD